MIVKYSNERIFWNTIGDNKPSKTYLDNLENRMTQTDIKINFEDFYNITIVSSRKDISYIITTHNGYKQYWFYNGISKIINGGYVLKFQLDLYATYTLSFLEYLKANNINVKLNRSHKLDFNSMYLKDDLLESVVKNYTNYVDEYINTTRFTGDLYERKYFLSEGTDLSFVRIRSLYNLNYCVSSGNLYYVFEIVSKGKLVLFPVLFDSSKDRFNQFRYMYYQLNTTLSTTTPNNSEIQIWNTKDGLEELKSSIKYSNKFVGIFVFKNFYTFKNVEGVYDYYRYPIDGNDPLSGRYYACLTIDINGVNIKNEPIAIDTNMNNVLSYNEQVPSFNYADKIHQYALKYFEYEYMGTPINVSLLYDNNGIQISNYIVNFTQSGFLKIFNANNEFYNIKEGIINFPANLPSWEDKYINYVNANKNQRDNQLNILKQTYEKNMVNNLFGGLFGFGKEIANGDIVGGFKSLFGTGMGFANTILGYQNAKNTMKAQYEDAKNTMGQTLNSGNIDDCLLGYYNSQFNNQPSYLIRHKNLSLTTIKDLNNVIYLYGANNPQIDTLTNFSPRNDFNYYLFDKQYLRFIFAQNISVDIPQEIYPYIIEQLSQGVRIWTTQPIN